MWWSVEVVFGWRFGRGFGAGRLSTVAAVAMRRVFVRRVQPAVADWVSASKACFVCAYGASEKRLIPGGDRGHVSYAKDTNRATCVAKER